MRPYEAVQEGKAFRGLVEVLDGYVGRRAIVLFSEGLAMPDVIPRLELVADAAAPAHVSFYTIDAAGLRVAGPPSPAARRLTAAELSSVSSPARLAPARIPEMVSVPWPAPARGADGRALRRRDQRPQSVRSPAWTPIAGATT